MSSFLERIEAPFMKIAGKLGEQPHLNAIRDGVIGALPLLLIGSLFMIAAFPPLPPESAKWYAEVMVGGKPLQTQLLFGVRALISLVGIYVTFGVASSLARRKDLDSLSAGLIAVAALFLLNGSQMLLPAPDAAKPALFIPAVNLGPGGLFMGIIIGLLVPMVMQAVRYLELEITMPAGVPPAVGRSFSALIPGLMVLLPLWIIVYPLGWDMFALINKWLTGPIQAVSQSGASVFVVLLVIILIDSILWLLGVHAVAILAPMAAIWLANIGLNSTAVIDLNQPATILNTREALQFYIWVGGSGATIVLPFLLLRAKAASLRAIAKVSAVPALFNINEPVIFGVPVMLNPTLAIPFILAPIVAMMITVAATSTGLVPVPYMIVPWTLPGPIGAFFSTGGAWQAAALSLVNIAIAGLIYWPFVDALDKRAVLQEAEAAKKNS